MRAVNLLPKDDSWTRRGLPSPWIMLAATAPLVAGCLVYFGYSSEHSKAVDKQAELASLQAQVDALTTRQSGLAAESSLLSLRNQRGAALQDALSKSMPWDIALLDLARVLPAGVSLTSLSAQSPTPAGSSTPVAAAPSTSGPQSFNLSGVAPSNDKVAELLERLSLLPMLTNVTLATTTTTSATVAPAASAVNGLGASTAPKQGPSQIQFTVTAGVTQLPSPATPWNKVTP